MSQGSNGLPTRRCLFCETDGALTREHVWPRWMAAVLPHGNRFSTRGKVGLRGSQPASQFGEVFESADSCSWTAKAVCSSCNSGWMSALESETRPIVAPLLVGEAAIIRAADEPVLFRWAVKTAITVSAGLGHPWRLEAQQAKALRGGGVPRVIARVSLAHVPHGLDGWVHVENLQARAEDRQGALFVEAVRGNLALSVGVAPLLGGLPAWHVLMPPGWAALNSLDADAELPEVELATVWGVSLARLKLLTMVGDATLGRLTAEPRSL
jgi:hypothetical protein